jgi:hypothetical protein
MLPENSQKSVDGEAIGTYLEILRVIISKYSLLKQSQKLQVKIDIRRYFVAVTGLGS